MFRKAAYVLLLPSLLLSMGALSVASTATPAAALERTAPRVRAVAPSVASTNLPSNCTRPVERRRGAWVCPVIPRASATASAPRAPMAAADVTRYCDGVWGCWSIASPHQAEFHSYTLNYGRNGTVLGHSSDYHVIWKTGSVTYNTSAQNAITLSTSSEYIVFSGSLFNGARDRVGSQISVCTDVDYGRTTVPANYRIQSPTPYCLLADNRNYDHNMASQLSFQIPGYSGYWYIYARSPVAHTGVLGGRYTFSYADLLPADRASAGWTL